MRLQVSLFSLPLLCQGVQFGGKTCFSVFLWSQVVTVGVFVSMCTAIEVGLFNLLLFLILGSTLLVVKRVIEWFSQKNACEIYYI